MNFPHRVLRWFFTLTLIEWSVAFVFFSANNYQGAKPYSISDRSSILLLTLIAITLSLMYLSASWWRNTLRSQRITTRVKAALNQNVVYWILIGLSGIIVLVSLFIFLAYLLFIRQPAENLFIGPLLQYLWIFALFSIIAALQFVVVMRILRFGSDLSVYKPYRKSFKKIIVTLVGLVIILIIISKTKYGLIPDDVGWGSPGVPILTIQVLFALALTSAAIGLTNIFITYLKDRLHIIEWKFPNWGIDLVVCILLWGLAVWLWSAQPLQPSYFSPAPLAPNFEVYPNSDSIHYDLDANKLLVGAGFDADAIRPIYVLFLALAQAVSGIGVPSVIRWQILAFSVLPALLYLFGRSLHHRFTGVLVGLLIIFHESNAIALAGKIDTANAKMIMADLPITIGVVIFALLIVNWLQRSRTNRLLLIAAGGILALSILIRVQVIVLLPVTLLVIIAFFRRMPSRWIMYGSILVGSVVIVLAPWILRTWQVTGKLTLSEMANPTQAMLLQQRYSVDLESDGGARLEMETESEYQSRMTGSAINFIIEQPSHVSRFVANHLVHNEISTALVLPAAFDLVFDLQSFDKYLPQWSSSPADLLESCCSLNAYVSTLPFWKSLDYRLLMSAWIPVLISLIVAAVGVAIAWNQWGLIGLLPLIFNLSYSFGNAFVRNSGWRYNLPVDWVGILYYAIGLAQISFWVITFLANRTLPKGGVGLPQPPQDRYFRAAYPWKSVIVVLLGFVMITAALPIIEAAVPYRFQDVNTEELLAIYEKQGLLDQYGLERSRLTSFLRQNDAVGLIGVAFYPRYFDAFEGENGTGWPDRVPKDFNRLGFYLAEDNRPFISLPVDAAPDYFPNASNVLVFGCQAKNHIKANVVIFADNPQKMLISPDINWECSN